MLLDRDGTIIKECHYLHDPNQVELLPGAVEGMRRMQALGLEIVVITNQSGLGRGYFSYADLYAVHLRLVELLSTKDINIAGFFYCPHHPSVGCPCRKPEIGLVEQAVKLFGFNPAKSFLAGDKECDVELGKKVGATSFLVRTGYGRELEKTIAADPDYIVDDLNKMALQVENLMDVEFDA